MPKSHQLQSNPKPTLNLFHTHPPMKKNYLEGLSKQFRYYKMLGDKTFAQLSDEQLFYRTDGEANSIAVIVKHLHGNMMSRWTDFLTSDGEKTWRNRDGEFDADITTRETLLQKWNEGWECLFTALASVNEDNFENLVYIRNMGHTIPEAFNRQLAHYAYHVGQIVFLGRMQKKDAWESLSIPKGKSKDYNNRKFKQEKRKAHFTEEFLPKKKKP